ncbi:MAG: multicopper oxidase domain-containing protein [Methylococcales bacterium]|nr:multicopper oxidase domain-containing protein [Methylococcales bacterium]
MTVYNSGRRRFLKHSALGAAMLALPDWLPASSGKITGMATPGFKPDVALEFFAQTAYVPIFAGGPETAVQKYVARLLKGPAQTLRHLPDNYLGPVLNLQQGQKVRCYFNNRLNEPCIIHWHGLHVPQTSDGHPMYSMPPGRQYVYEFEVLNRAGTSFYHSHTHGLTAEQVYRGLAGLIVIGDEQESRLDLPRGEYDLPLVIQDRSFDAQNQLRYPHGMPQRMLGFLGDTVLVNGKPNAEFSVKSRAYRFRALNGSNSRIYKLGWEDGAPLTAIGADAGLLEKPEQRPYIMLSPGERVDLWLDFSGRAVGSRLIMYSLPFSGVMPAMYERMSGRMGMMLQHSLPQGGKFPVATFRISEKVGDSPALPEKLAAIRRLTESDTDNARNPLPIAMAMRPMRPTLNGKSFAMDRVMDFEKVSLGSFKKIRIFHDRSGMGMMAGGHGMGGRMRRGMESGSQHDGQEDGGHMGGNMMMEMAHPIHLHGQQFQIIGRNAMGVNANSYETVRHGFMDSGWKDTVLVMPGEEVTIIKPFQDYSGLYLYHCHNLEHENAGMMRQFLVG